MFEEEVHGYINPLSTGIKERLCIDCARRIWQKELEKMVEIGPLQEIKDSDGDNWFGKICKQCHAKIGPWKECKYCHSVMTDEESHELCDELRANPEALEAILNGLEETDGWVEEYEEDAIPD